MDAPLTKPDKHRPLEFEFEFGRAWSGIWPPMRIVEFMTWRDVKFAQGIDFVKSDALIEKERKSPKNWPLLVAVSLAWLVSAWSGLGLVGMMRL